MPHDIQQDDLKLQILEEEIKTLNLRLSAQSEKLQFKTEMVDSLRSELTFVHNRADKLEESLQVKSKQIDELHNSLINKQKLLDTVQKEMINRSGILDQIKDKLHSTEETSTHVLEREIDQYEMDMSRLRDEITKAKKVYADKEKMYTQSLEHMNRVIQEKEVSLDETVSQLKEKDTIAQTLKQELKANHEDLLKYKAELNSLEDKFNDKNQELANVRKGLTSWIERVKSQNIEIKSKESELIVLKSELKTQEREIQNLRSQLRADKARGTHQENVRKTPYEILGVTPENTFEEIKKAHRRAVNQYNPHIVETLGEDVKTLVIETSKEINLAFSWFKKKFNIS